LQNWILFVSLAFLVCCCGDVQASDSHQRVTTSQYKWLLAYVGRTTNELVADKRFNSLLNNVVPNKTVFLVGRPTSLRKTFRKMLTDAPDFVTMRDKEYFAFGGKDKNQPDDKALIWLDWRTGRSAIAIVHHYGPDDPKKYSNEPMLYVASNTLNAANGLPSELKFAVKNWVIIENVTPTSITYNGEPASATLIF
jgi:hypothetical protein